MAAALVLAGLTATASQAGLKTASTSGTGAVLALAAQLRSARLHAAAAANGTAPRYTPGGRALLPRRMLRSGALVGRAAAAASVVPISGGVQTYDVDSPPPAFRPLVGFGSVASLNNSSTNPPVYATSLQPTNMHTVWSADETFLVFSSNRASAPTLSATGQPQLGVNSDGMNADGTVGPRFHLWAISVNGGEAFQITASTGLINGGEIFPTLSPNNLTVAFTSDASSPGFQNLYTLPFSYSMISTGTIAPTQLTASAANSNPPASLTLRGPNEAASSLTTGFSQVQRPTFSPNDPQEIVFSALSIVPTGYTDPYAGVYHLYYLFTSSGGFSPGQNVSYPGKLTDGPANDTDPTFAPDGTLIAFSSTADANGFTVNPNNASPTNPSAQQDPNASQSLSSGVSAGGLRSVFLISGGGSTGAAFGTVPASGSANLTSTGGRVSQGSTAGLDDFGPAWSNFANQNQYTNPSGQFGYLAFARSEPAVNPNHDIVFFQVAKGVSQPSTEMLVPETDRAGANAALTLNTDDNAGETLNDSTGNNANPGNAFDDIYPTWSPFLSVFSIAYSSNRTVTYNNPVGNQPVEVAASVAPGGSVTAAAGQDQTPNFTVGTGYSGLLISQVLNLDPPTLLRFSPNEVVHVQAPGPLDANGNSVDPVKGTPNKLAATGGQKITLTVRLSSREASIADTGGPNGGPRVYVQIKDPDGKYDDTQNSEHKVFAKDSRYNGQPNQPLSDVTSDSINQSISNNTGQGYGNNPGFGYTALNKYVYPSYMDGNGKANNTFVQYVNPRGAHGGHYFTPDSNNPSSTYTFIGKGARGTTNPAIGNFQLTDPTDPAQFIPQGPEYEAQVVNPQFLAVNPTPNTLIGDPTVTVAYPAGYTTPGNNPGGTRTANATGSVGDYVSPYWLAGVNDQGAFTGGAYASNTGASALPTTRSGVTPNGVTQTDRPTTGYTTTGRATDGTPTTTTHPAEWLQLTRVPTGTDGTQNGDANGGVLYTVTWQTPMSGSDFYVDVIAYDNAIFPNVPNSTYSGKTTNWRIYDNVGGFSTVSSVGGNDILLVSDYALGQKFAATTFGGRNLNLNLVPKLFGTESYLSAVDANILPDSVYAGIPTTPTSYVFNPAVQPLFNGFFAISTNEPTPGAQNGLGVASYLDNTIQDNTVSFDGFPNVRSQNYSIWRILSRGPVPASTLSNYLPNKVPQPAIADAADPAYSNVPAATILDAQRCVVWLSPYTGDVLADPGTIDDPGNIGAVGVTNPRQSTTSILTSFVRSGGRLCITGQDVGSTLTQSGTVGNTAAGPGPHGFLPDVLDATLTANNSGVNVLAATANRITGSPFYDNTNAFGNGSYNSMVGPIDNPLESFPVFPYQDNLVLGDSDFSDSGLSQIPALRLPGGASIQGQQDAIAAANGAITAATYGAGGPGAIVYHDDPYKAGNTGALPNGGTGSRVVYAACGLEALSQDYYASASPNPASGIPPSPPLDQRIPAVLARNVRSEVLHNIVSFLRTGRVSGTITQTSGTGQGGGLPIGGVTVYLRPTGGAPSSRPAFSALTSSGGSFTIAGVEPGTYTLVAIKPGFQRAVSNNNVSFTVEGDVSKTGATLTMTPEAPGNIAGTVHDTANNPINMSVVTFKSQDNSVTVSATTVNGSVPSNPAENYFIQNVPVTNYTGTASSPTNPAGQPEYTAATAPDAPPAGSPAGTPDFSKGVTVQPNTTIQPVNFTLTPILATISGTVTSTAGGAPIAGATVTITNSAGTVVGTTAVTAADGTYKLTGVPATQTATTYTLTATAPGFAASTPVSVPNVYLGSIITGVNLMEAPIAPGAITGTVTYAPGGVVSGPVANATVTYTAPGGAAQTVQTGADGTYTIPAVPPATYTVSAAGPLNANGKPTTMPATAQQVVVTSGNTSTANFTVTPIAPSFSGTVVSAAMTGPPAVPSKPLAGATVTITGTDAAGTAIAPITVKTAANGTYTTGPLAPGTYTLTASLPGYTASAPIGPTTVQLGDVMTGDNFTLTAVPPGSITGTVKDNQGNPVAGATVTFNSTDGTVHPKPATTDSAGVYVIPPAGTAANIPASTYTGTAVGTNSETGAAQYGSALAQTVSVPAGGSATANFVLPVNLASVSGTVTDIQSSAAVSGATVTLLNPAGTVVAGPIVTGTSGTFSFTGINALQSPQTYTVSVTAPNYFPGSTPVTLSLGDALTGIAVTLNEQATLVGLVTDGSPDATGQPLSGVTITVTDANGNAIATTPAPLTTINGATKAPDGLPENYTATLLPGKYTITATKGSYTSQTTALITLTNAAPVRVNFALVSSIGTLGGLVTDLNGTGLTSGATVTAVPTGSTTGLTFTTNATSSAGPDGQPLNYTGQLSQGTYTVTVTKGSRTSAPQKVTITGGTFKRLDFTGANGLPALHTFPAGLQFVSTPYDYSALGFNGLFGALNTAPAGTTSNGNRSNVAVWNPLTGAYALDPNAPADTLRLGVGYWVYLKNPTAVTQQGAPATGPFVSVALGQGWNQIGVPNPSAAGIPISSLMFANGTGGMISFAQASGPQYNLVTRPLYGYAGGGYQALSTSGVLTPWNAYWIYVNAAATLEIPIQTATTTTPPTTTPTGPPLP